MMMAIKTEEKRLLDALMNQEVLLLQGFTFELEDNIGVVVAKRDHVRGFWRHVSGQFAWTPAGQCDATISVQIIDEAVAHTLKLAEQ